ncbi:uncharacterized protein LOC143038535 [Oratosquilla oratoria]|uniref:uncharacterized protein LOC143038535 n=1 Tax=Oratosquilla oratoria TaxID=337810 RepID=UPI003F773D9B
MCDEQTDWLKCGVRRFYSQRVRLIMNTKKQEWDTNLQQRRQRLQMLLKSEQEQYKKEMHRHTMELATIQAAVQKENAALQCAEEEEKRLQLVHQLYSQLKRKQCPDYASSYSQMLQDKINATRQEEIALHQEMLGLLDWDPRRNK